MSKVGYMAHRQKMLHTPALTEFVQVLKVLAKDCEFKDVTAAKNQEDLVRGAFISGISIIRQRLLEHSELDLRTAIDFADSLDMAQKQSALYSSCKVPATISAIADCKNDDNSAKTESPTVAVAVQKKEQLKGQRLCLFCGGLWNHTRSNCSTRDSICKACGIKGHYSRVCRKSKGARRSWSSEPESASASAAFLASAVTKDPPVSLASNDQSSSRLWCFTLFY